MSQTLMFRIKMAESLVAYSVMEEHVLFSKQCVPEQGLMLRHVTTSQCSRQSILSCLWL